MSALCASSLISSCASAGPLRAMFSPILYFQGVGGAGEGGLHNAAGITLHKQAHTLHRHALNAGISQSEARGII